MEKYYRILVEVDENGEQIPSVAVVDSGLNIIVEWFGSVDDAIEWVKDNGQLATLN